MGSLAHLISTEQLRAAQVSDVVKHVHSLDGFLARGGLPRSVQEKRVALLFYGPVSRRTYDSFVMAVQDLGYTKTGGPNAESFSGMVGGESLEHAMLFYSSLCQAIVLRHQDGEAQERASACARVPILSAGGSKEGEHPTQALGDVALLRKLLGRCEGKEVAYVGNLRDSSSVHSHCYLFKDDMPKVYVVSPEGQGLPQKYADVLESVTVVESVRDLPRSLHALYLVQSPGVENPERFHVTRQTLDCFDRVRVLHPLPAGSELAPELLRDDRIFALQQMMYAHFARIACLEMLVHNK